MEIALLIGALGIALYAVIIYQERRDSKQQKRRENESTDFSEEHY